MSVRAVNESISSSATTSIAPTPKVNISETLRSGQPTRPISLIGRTSVLDPDLFPLDSPVIVSNDQISSMLIRATGVSDRSIFQGSRFRAVRDGQVWLVTKYQYAPLTLQLSRMDGTQSTMAFEVPSEEFKEMLELGVPMFALDRVPDQILGRGAMGQVYRTNFLEKEVVFKILNQYLDVREGCTFFPDRLRSPDAQENRWLRYVSQASKEDMIRSFRAAVHHANNLRKLTISRHYPQSHGVVYIRELNVWGVVSDFIEGKTLPTTYKTPKQALEIMKDVACGLQILDSQGYPYTDVKSSNIMTISDHHTVIIDDVATRNRQNERSESRIRSRQEFGVLLYRSLQSFHPELKSLAEQEIPSERWIGEQQVLMREKWGDTLSRMICECWSERSIEEVSWDSVISSLELLLERNLGPLGPS